MAGLLAGMCAIVLHTLVYTDFERQRFIVSRTTLAAADGTVAVALPALSPLAGQPVALILRLAGDPSAFRVARVAVGGATLAEVPLPPGRNRRIDLSLADGAMLADGNLFEVTSNGNGWALTYLEVANVHGFSRGLIEFMVVPSAARGADRQSLLLAAVLFLVMLRLPPASAAAVQPRPVRITYAAAAWLVPPLLAAVALAPLVSDYRVLLARHTFFVLLVLVYLSTLHRVVRELATSATVRAAAMPLFGLLLRGLKATWSQRIPLLYLASVAMFAIGVTRFHDPESGFTFFIRFGSHLEDRLIPTLRNLPIHVRPDSVGYDGQFYAQLAVDPLLLDPATAEALDQPSYRARRILFSWTAFLLGLGQPLPIVHAYAIQNALFWLLLAMLLLRWFPARDFRSFCLWFACVFAHGVAVSIVRALPDGPSLLLLCLTLLAVERARPGCAAVLTGLAGLAKDSNLIWSAVLLDPRALRARGWHGFWRYGVVVVAPLALWMTHLWLMGYTTENMAGVRNFAAPLSGYVTTWSGTVSEIREGTSPWPWLKALSLIGLTTQAIGLVVLRNRHDAWWRAGIVSCVLMVFLGPAVWEGHPPAATRVLLPMTVAFNALLPNNRWFWPLFVLGNLSVLHGLAELGLIDWPALLDALTTT